jgi:hypothetical protein
VSIGGVENVRNELLETQKDGIKFIGAINRNDGIASHASYGRI